MNPFTLFTLLIADLNDVLERDSWGGIKVGSKRIFSLAYADEVAVIAKNEGAMKEVIRVLEKYVE